jgi:hypothetical protein
MSLPMSLSCAYAQWPMAYGLSDLLTSLEVLCKLSRAQAGQGPRLPGWPGRRQEGSQAIHFRCTLYAVSYQAPY